MKIRKIVFSLLLALYLSVAFNGQKPVEAFPQSNFPITNPSPCADIKPLEPGILAHCGPHLPGDEPHEHPEGEEDHEHDHSEHDHSEHEHPDDENNAPQVSGCQLIRN